MMLVSFRSVPDDEDAADDDVSRRRRRPTRHRPARWLPARAQHVDQVLMRVSLRRKESVIVPMMAQKVANMQPEHQCTHDAVMARTGGRRRRSSSLRSGAVMGQTRHPGLLVGQRTIT